MSSPGLFGPDLWAKLQAHPDTAALLSDADFKAKIEELQRDPSTLSKHIGDPRMMKVFTVLAQTKMPTGPPPGAGPEASPDKAAPSPPSPPVEPEVVEEDLSPEQRAEREKLKGNEAYRKREFEKALEHYNRAFELNDRNVAYLTNKAAVYFETSEYQKAIESCQEAIKLNREKGLRSDFKVIARAHARIASAWWKLGDLVKTIDEYEKSLVEYHDDKVYNKLLEAKRAKKKADDEAYWDPEISKEERAKGNEMFRAGKFPEAVKYYTEAIKRNPKDPAPYSNRAAAYTRLGEFPMALRDCDKCLELDPKYMKAYSRKGSLHFGMKEYYKCLDVYKKGLEIDPNSKEMREGLFKTQLKIQEIQKKGGDEEVSKRAMQDPEIQKILQDPVLQQTLKQMETDPSFAAKAMRDPAIAEKIQKLIAAGILKVGDPRD